MVYWYLIRGSLRQSSRYPLRSTLVVSCAAFGIAGVIASINYASGGRQQVLGQIQRMGTNLIVVRAEQSRTTAGRARTGSIVTTLGEPDYLALRREVEGPVRSSAVVTTALRVKAGEFSKMTPVIGCEPAYFKMKSWNVKRGVEFDRDDVRRAARVALLGYSVAVDLYGTKSPTGERLFINRVPFEVVGVLTERGQGLDAVNEDAQVYVPLTTAMRRLLNVAYFNALVFEIGDWNQMDRTARDMIEILRARHRTSVTRPADFQVQNQKELVDALAASSERLAFVVRWIGLVGLLVSGLGVLAIAWIAVRNRTVEIGTRRALGARSTDIFFQFAFEASVLAACGSIAGLGLGWSVSRVAAASAGLPFLFESEGAAVALGSSLALNLAFATGPALGAARIDPIRAIARE